MKTKPRTIVIFLIIVAATAGLLIYGIPKLPIGKSNQRLLSGLLLTFGGSLLTPIREPYQAFVNSIWFPNKPSRCDIFIFGISGSGKTSLINSWMLTNPNKKIDETENLKFYFGKSEEVPFRVLDYKGQKPKELTEKLTKNSFKPNAAIFIVDVLPLKDEDGTSLFNRKRALN